MNTEPLWFYLQVPPIDSLSSAGKKLDNLVGQIRLANVHFNYPSRPDVKVSGLTHSPSVSDCSRSCRKANSKSDPFIGNLQINLLIVSIINFMLRVMEYTVFDLFNAPALTDAPPPF